MPREGHGSRNTIDDILATDWTLSCPARGMGVEIEQAITLSTVIDVMPREGHGSRNREFESESLCPLVMPRERHGSRNCEFNISRRELCVMPREGHGSRNLVETADF